MTPDGYPRENVIVKKTDTLGKIYTHMTNTLLK